MGRPTRLSDDEITRALGELPGWTLAAGKLHRELAFVDFVTAFGFMSAAALIAEKLDHHPEWFNVYGTVRVDLQTHDAGGVTRLDLELAAAMDRLAARLPQK
jgi:4a-hydroxytetrahydrobiopterin dehydratase